MAESRIEELRRRVGRDPGSRLFAQLAEEERKAGDLNEAIRIARAGLAVHPEYPAALLTLGRALIESGDGEGARAALQAALKHAPDNILASRFLGQALEDVGDLEGADRQYRATLKLAPGDSQLEEWLRTLEQRLARARAAAGSAPAATLRAVLRAEVEKPAGELGPTVGPRPAAPARVPGAPAVATAAAPGAPQAASAAAGGGGAGTRAEGDAPPFSSSTLAELYLRQGFAERAVEVYRQLVAERPDDQKARGRLAELVSLVGAEAVAGPKDAPEARRRALERTIAGLEVLLGVARRR